MKLIGYVRVSSDEQAKDGCSLQMQREKIILHSQVHDHELIQIAEDAAISAKNIAGRPGFKQALELVMAGAADGLVVWKLDRAFRSTRDALDVAEALNKKGKAFISISETIDTSSATGEFFFTLLAALATMERKLIGERTSAALKSKKERGERVGDIPFGYNLAEDGISLMEAPAELAIISQIKSDRARGCSYRSIADSLNTKNIPTKKAREWSHVQVARICRQQASC